MGLSEITPGKAQEYRVHRISTSRTGKPPARSTIHDEIVTLRQVLKTAIRHGWLEHLPDFSPPYKSQGKVTHRPWFSPEEYKQLYEKTRAHAKAPSLSISGLPSNSTTTSCFLATPACDPTKPRTCSIVTSRLWRRASWRANS